jgi:hypothetical protein
MTELHLLTKVLPGNRIEVTNPQLNEGDQVEVIVKVAPKAQVNQHSTVLDFLDSLPPGPRSASTWAEVERQFREERDSWDR